MIATSFGADPPLPLLTPEYQGDISTFTRRYFQALCQRLGSPFILLFDNYQRLPAAAPFHAMLAEALDHFPAGARCVISSRGEPPPALTRARLYGQLAMIEAEALRLTLPEAEGIAALQSEHRLTADQVHSLHERVQGWAAGLTLLLRRSPSNPTPPLPTVEIIFDYFATEVFSQADPATQTFLLKTALLPRMTAAMADQLTGGNRAEALLNGLVRSHYFTFRDESTERRYQYHDLFRDFLLSRGRDAFSATERAHDQWRAAEILEAAGEIGAAVELWQTLGDWEHLGRLINQHAQALLRQGRNRLLESWLVSFPAAFRTQSPWLLFWLGQCQLTHDPVAARANLARAYRHFKHAGAAAGLWLTWSAITDTYNLTWDNFTGCGAWLVEFERLRARYPRFPSPSIEARVTCGVFNTMVHARPGHPEFADWEQRITRLLQTDCPPDLYLVSLNALLYHYIWKGVHRTKALWALDALRAAHARFAQPEPVLLCILKTWEFSYQYFYEGELEKCLALADAARTVATEYGVGFFNSLTFANAVYINLSAGRLEAGRAALARFKPIVKSFRHSERAHHACLCGWEAWLSGRLPEALETLEHALQITRPFFENAAGLPLLGLAQTHASLGNRSAALHYLAEMRRWSRATHSPLGAFMHTLAAAQFALAWGRKIRGLGLLNRALALGNAGGYVFFPFFKPDDIARLCAAALDADIEVEYARTLIRKRGLLPDPSASVSERWPWPVRIYTLGRFALVVDDHTVAFSRKAQHKPLELLKILIAWGGRDIHQARIADALWPDAEGDSGQHALTTTLHRLRRLLRHDQALSLRDGRLTLDPRYCWVDVWCLERYINQTLARVREADGRIGPTDLATVTHTLLHVYPGPFLGPDSETWALQAHNRLRDQYLKCLEEVGAYLETLGNWEMGRACYQRGLEIAPTSEHCRRGLTRCHERLEHTVEALKPRGLEGIALA